MVGVALIMGGDTTSSSCMVQAAGQAWQLDQALLKSEFLRGETLQLLLLRYTQALISQSMQTAACIRHHSVDQQLSRWLLVTSDRVSARALVTTEELLASILGVSRDGINEATGKLQHAGLISSRRGHITVLDHKGLEARVCECYAAGKLEQARLLAAERYR